MCDSKRVEVLDASHNLEIKTTCLLLSQSVTLDDVVEKFTTLGILHYKIYALRVFDDFIKFNESWMIDALQNFYFSHYPLNVCLIFNTELLKNFHCN